jgi:soluble lytic murein transglycosylase-like protein
MTQVIAKCGSALRTFAGDVAQGFFEIAHNGFAVVGLVLAFLTVTMVAKPELRQQSETALISWLQERQPVVEVADVIEAEPDAIERATAANPKDLPKQQAAVAYWLSKKYRVAPEPVSALVVAAYEVGAKVKIEPTLILAVMAIESGFNPFAQSPVGAQGLMQVMTTVHTEKYEDFGGRLAAFDPVTNLRVGATVLRECISRAGSIEGGLRQYVGATSDATEGGYALKVIAEHSRLRAVAGGKAVPTFVPPAAHVIPVVAPNTRRTPAALPEAAKTELEDKIAALVNS